MCCYSFSCGLQAFREDRTLIAAADYIADALGQRFVESVPLNMENAWAESHPKCPLICLLSPGLTSSHLSLFLSCQMTPCHMDNRLLDWNKLGIMSV